MEKESILVGLEFLGWANNPKTEKEIINPKYKEAEEKGWKIDDYDCYPNSRYSDHRGTDCYTVCKEGGWYYKYDSSD